MKSILYKAFYLCMLVLVVSLLLTACGGGGGGNGNGNGSDGNTSSTSPPPTTIAEALRVADQNGAYPSLNRDDTVAGPDTDNNGVRDDIDAYINSLPDSAAQKAALRQASSAIRNSMLVDTTSQSALLAASNKISNASSCIFARYDPTIAGNKGNEIEKLTVNTKTRFLAYNKFSQALSGTTSLSPQGDGCEQ